MTDTLLQKKNLKFNFAAPPAINEAESQFLLVITLPLTIIYGLFSF